jgi:hypothetical protein
MSLAEQCGDWKWKQCYVTGIYLIYAALGVLCLIVLLCVGCICRCFCCNSKKRDSSRSLDKLGKNLDSSDDRTPLITKQTTTSKRREEMRKKWGIGEDQSDNA